MRLAIAAAVASAALLRLSFEVSWLLPLALVPVAWVATRERTSRAGRLAVPLAYALYLETLLVPSLPFGIADGQWGAQPFPLIVGGSPVLLVALVLVPLAGLLLYAARLGSVPPGAPAWAAVLVPAAAWTALEVVRVKLDPGGLWGLLFASAPGELAEQVAPVAGPFAVTFVVVAAAYALALRAAVPLAVLAAAVLAVAIADRPAEPGAPLRVAAIQPGYDTAQDELLVLRFWTVDRQRASLDLVGDLAALTRDAAGRGADLVVWPEAVAWVDVPRDPKVAGVLQAVARDTDTTLVVPTFQPGPDHGATLVVDPAGRISHAQPKQRPMWFLGERGDNRVPPDPVEARAASIGTTLGVDNQDPAIARRLAHEGATLLTSSTHDWQRLVPHQQRFTAAHARATRMPVVKADWRYGSAIYDASGKALADAGARQQRAIVVADVEPATVATPYARLPHLPNGVLVAAALAVLGLAALRPRTVAVSGRRWSSA